MVRAGSSKSIATGRRLHEIKLHVDHPHPHTDTRLAHKLADGHYLVCHEGDGVVREYDASGKVTWDFPVPLFGHEPKPGHGPEAFGNKCFAALRLANGNTLVTTGNGHSVLEVTPQKEIVWQIEQNDLPGITLAWVTTLAVLPNGNYLIGNCHAGPGQPLVVELDPKTKKVVWKFDQFDTFGNTSRTRWHWIERTATITCSAATGRPQPVYRPQLVASVAPFSHASWLTLCCARAGVRALPSCRRRSYRAGRHR